MIAINKENVKTVTLHDKRKTDYVLWHAKGDTYYTFPFMKRKYTENKYCLSDVAWECRDVCSETESSLLNDNYLIEDSIVYKKPYIEIRYNDKSSRNIYYDTYEDAKMHFNNLCTSLGLIQL